MALTIDSLQLEIQASAEKANKAIDSLIGNLGRLSKSLDGVDTKNLSNEVSGLSKNMSKFSLSFSKFGSTSKTFSKTFSNLKHHMSGTVGVTGKIVNGFRNIKSASDKGEKSISKFAQTVGMLYARFWLLKRALGGVWRSIKSSMDYIETLNYYEASFGQVATNAVKDWKKAGYDSAEAYYKSFEKRAKTLTQKMSGFMITDEGTLEATGGGLGLDPAKVMNYQAQFAQMASSMGVASDTAMVLSEALTKIGADLASVKNLDFEEVWGNMASGLVGMSRTLDKYGVNIRNANMETKLAELGIDATVDSLSQADKAMLRTIILIDSTRYAWGDLAKTISAPSNQLRLLTANWHNLCRMIGNLFLPLVSKVLPYLNAMVIALQRLVTWIAKLLGVDLSVVTKDVGASNEAIGDILDESEGLGDSLDDASEKAKKLKNNLLGVDELNIVSDNEDNNLLGNLGATDQLTDALLDALSDYELAWDEAFKNMENKAQELADKIQKFFKDLAEPIFKGWDKEKDHVSSAWKKAFQELGALAKSVGEDFWEVWHQDNTVKIFENLFHILGDIGDIVANLAHNFREAWEENDRGLHILENIRDIVMEWTNIQAEVADYIVEISKDLNFAPILESIKNLTRAIADNANDIFGIVGDLQKRMVDFGKYLLEEFFPKALDIATKLVSGIEWGDLRDSINTIWVSLEKIAEAIGNGLLVMLDKLSDWFIKFINGGFIKTLASDFEKLAETLNNAKSLKDVINGIFDFTDSEAKNVVSVFNDFVKNIKQKLDELLNKNGLFGESTFHTLGRRFGESLSNLFSSIDWKSLGGVVSNLIIGLEEVILGAISGIDWNKVGQSIGTFLANIKWGTILLNVVKIIGKTLGGLIEAWFGSFLEAPFSTSIATALGGVVIGVAVVKKLLSGLAIHFVSESCVKVLSDGIGSLITKAFGSKTVTETFSKGMGSLPLNLEMFGEGGTFASIASVIGGIVATVGGAITAVVNFFKMLSDGFDWLHEILMVVGIAITAVGAVILGAEALVAGVVAGIVALVATGVVLLKEHWEEVKGWFADLGGWLSEHIGQPIKEFFTEKIPQALQDFKDKVNEWKEKVKEHFTDFKDSVVGKVTEWKESVTEKFEDFKENTKQKFSDWKESVIQTFTDWKERVSEVVNGWKTNLEDKISEWSDKVVSKLSDWAVKARDAIKDWFEETKQKFVDWKDSIVRTIDEWKANILAKFDEWKQAVVNKVNEWKEDIKAKFNEWKSNIESTVEEWKENIKSKIHDFAENAKSTIKGWVEDTKNAFHEWKEKLISDVKQFAEDAKAKIDDFKEKAKESIKNFAEDSKSKIKDFADKSKETIEDWKTKFCDWFEETKNNVVDKAREMVEKAKDYFSSKNWSFDGIKNGLGSAFDRAFDWARQKWESIKSWFGSLDFSFGISGFATGGFPYQTFATGGLPEDGWFRASHGELLGRFDNGQTVVANNMQIIEGIKGGVESAVASVLAPYLADIADNTAKTANKSQSVVIDGREIVSAYDSRKERNGYSFS